MSIIQGKRAVAYFDIMGFKKKIEQTPIEELADTYEKLIKQTKGLLNYADGNFFWEEVCYRYIFSDSIFLLARDDTEVAFTDMISYAWRMMQSAIAMGLPLRGAVSYGEIYADIETNIFLGESIVSAVLLEERQNWIGAIVDSSAIQRYGAIFNEDSILSGVMKCLLPKYEVPFKCNERQQYHVINWRENMISKNGIKKLFKNEPFDKSVQEKIDNTLAFSKAIVETNCAYLNDDNVPIRFRRFYISDSPPEGNQMFVNGDEY